MIKRINLNTLGIIDKIFIFTSSMIIAFLPGIISNLNTKNYTNNIWYMSLEKSNLTPDGYLFPIIWCILYALIGIALYKILISNKPKKMALAFLFINLGFNAIWTTLFFNLNSISFAFIDSLILIYTAIKAKQYAYQTNKMASYLLIPYIIWLCFATYLTFITLILN